MFINMQSTLHIDDFNVLNGLTTFTPTVIVHILYLGFGTHRCRVADRPAQHSTVPERKQHFLSQGMQNMRKQKPERRSFHAVLCENSPGSRSRGHMAKIALHSKEITGSPTFPTAITEILHPSCWS